MKKDSGAVKMMRDIREKRDKEYSTDPKLRMKRLAAIRENTV